MPTDRLDSALAARIAEVDERGTSKRHEAVVTAIVPATGGLGPRVLLAGEEDRMFLRMNSNAYLGLSSHPAVVEAEERATREFGAGPGAVRFISGTLEPHVRLEARLAEFHGREAAMVFSSAYGTVLGVLPSLVTPTTALVSDALNHNCIINATKLAQPASKVVYPHLDLEALDGHLEALRGTCDRAIVVTDGVFSMRGDHAPLDRIAEVVARHDPHFAENAVLVVDDSHGVGALGGTGRGTEEVTGTSADVLVATLGKALGVNGGYVVGSRTLVDHLRETAPTYIYSNPITASEAAAATAALDVLDSAEGIALLDRLRASTAHFRAGLVMLGYETIPGEHPVVPLLVRDTARTSALVAHLRANGVLATGLGYPVVPRGDDEIRFQISAAHTDADVNQVLDALETFSG